MNTETKQSAAPVIQGIAAGFGLAALVALLACLPAGGHQPVQWIVNTLTSVPTWLVAAWQGPAWLEGILLFVYWMLIGGLCGGAVGWWRRRSSWWRVGFMLIGVGCLVIAHQAASQQLERQLIERMLRHG